MPTQVLANGMTALIDPFRTPIIPKIWMTGQAYDRHNRLIARLRYSRRQTPQKLPIFGLILRSATVSDDQF